MKTRVFLRRPEVPGRCPSNGVVGTVCTLPSLVGVKARPLAVVDEDYCEDSLCRSRFISKTEPRAGEINDERGTRNDELKAVVFQFIVPRSAFIVPFRP